MFIFRRIFALIVSAWFLLNPVSTATVGFSEGTPIVPDRKECRYDNDRLLIGAYAFRSWGINDDNVRYMSEAGLDFIISAATKEYLDLCEKYSVGVIAQGYGVPHSSQIINDEKFNTYSTLNKLTAKDHPALWGDDVVDEPLFETLDRAGQCLGYYDSIYPDKNGFINLLPGNAFDGATAPFSLKAMHSVMVKGLGKVRIDEYAGTKLEGAYAQALYHCNPSVYEFRKYVSDFVNKVPSDYVSVDIYPLRLNDVTLDMWLPTLDVCASAARDTGRDFWVITQSSGYHDNEDKGEVRACSEEDIRWQMYTSLAFGAKAVVHATYLGGWWDHTANMIDDNGNRTENYYSVQKINSEVEVFSDIYGGYKWNGCYLTNGHLAEGTESGYLDSKPDEISCNVKTESPVLTGCFESESDSSKAYVFVNMNNTADDESARINVAFDDAEKITVYRKGVITELDGNSLDITLDNEEGIFVIVS